MRGWQYVVMAVALPIAWGLLSAWMFDRFRGPDCELEGGEAPHQE